MQNTSSVGRSPDGVALLLQEGLRETGLRAWGYTCNSADNDTGGETDCDLGTSRPCCYWLANRVLYTRCNGWTLLLQGYWTYEVCPGRHLRQIRLEGGRATISHSLGSELESAMQMPLGQASEAVGNVVQQIYTGAILRHLPVKRSGHYCCVVPFTTSKTYS